MSRKTELDFLKKVQIPINLIVKHIEDYHPDFYQEYSDLIQNYFRFISKKVKIILLEERPISLRFLDRVTAGV
jgi:UDP-N-acetylmuramate-alanine ligase